jgi:hypothetical protein
MQMLSQRPEILPSTHSVAEGQEECKVDGLIEAVSEQGSELFETDSHTSSNGQEEAVFADVQDHHSASSSEKLPSVEEQGRDIVAGSPTKIPAAELEVELAGRQEMGGTIVYDSYARLTGCEKIEQYFSTCQKTKINPYILFSKEEVKEVMKERTQLFGDKARERDFVNDNDRYLYRNLPRFSAERDFTNP